MICWYCGARMNDYECPECERPTRFINCETCQTEGRIYTANGNNPDWTDHGPCPACNGVRTVEVVVQPIEMEDLDD